MIQRTVRINTHRINRMEEAGAGVNVLPTENKRHKYKGTTAIWVFRPLSLHSRLVVCTDIVECRILAISTVHQLEGRRRASRRLNIK